MAIWNGKVGVQGGIPKRTDIFVNVLRTDQSAYRCRADGVHDDSGTVMAAILHCPSNQVVYLPAGSYLFANPISIPASHGYWTLRGDGSTTLIRAALPIKKPLIFCGGGDWLPAHPELSSKLTGGYNKGSTTISISDAAQIFVGQLLWIDELNDGTNVTSNGSGGLGRAYDRTRTGARSLGQMVEVMSISGQNLTIWPPLVYTYSAALLPEATRIRCAIRGVGIENLKIYDSTGNDQFHICYDSSQNCWIKGVETYGGAHWHVLVDFSLSVEIRDSYFHEASTYTVNAGYGLEMHLCTGCLVENNIFWHLYAPLLINSGDSGNVIAYNFVCQTYDSNPSYQISGISANHGPHAMMNLYEGNVFNRLQADFYYGSSSHATLFRNWMTGCDPDVTENRFCLMLDAFSLSNNVVGNVLGSPSVTNWIYDPFPTNAFSHTDNVIYRLGYPQIGNNTYRIASNTPGTNDLDLRVAATLLRHGNYDFATRSTIWNPQVGITNLPASMYLTEKPAWWGTNPWPAIGPDLTPMTGRIPAVDRFQRIQR